VIDEDLVKVLDWLSTIRLSGQRGHRYHLFVISSDFLSCWALFSSRNRPLLHSCRAALFVQMIYFYLDLLVPSLSQFFVQLLIELTVLWSAVSTSASYSQIKQQLSKLAGVTYLEAAGRKTTSSFVCPPVFPNSTFLTWDQGLQTLKSKECSPCTLALRSKPCCCVCQ